MDIDKLILATPPPRSRWSFSSLMDIDKLIHLLINAECAERFSSLMDIDKLILCAALYFMPAVLVH